MHCKCCKGVKQKFSKDPEEGTTKSGFERRNWGATKHVSVDSQSATVAVRDDVVGGEGGE